MASARNGWSEIHAGGREGFVKGRTSRITAVALHYGSFLDPTAFISHATINASPVLFLNFSVRDIQIHLAGAFCLEFQTREVEDFVVVDGSSTTTAVYLTRRRLYEVLFEDCGVDGLRGPVLAFCRTIVLEFDATFEDTVVQTVVEFLFAVDKVLYEAAVQAGPPRRTLHASLELPEGSRHANSWAVQLAWLTLTTTPGFVFDRFTDAFFAKLEECTVKLAESVLYGMGKLLQQDLFLDPLVAFERARTKGYSTRDVENPVLHCRVPRMTMTPTRWIFFEPDIIQTNRVLREWGSHAQFLRVSIRDEDFSRLSTSKGKLGVVLNKMVNGAKDDLRVAKRRFRFLGCSNNQVRDHGCFFVDVTDDETLVSRIRAWAGNLDSITNVAKYVARLGQVFSTSTKTVTVDNSDIAWIPDIQENGYCFTDGIGKMTQDLAVEVAKKLGTNGTVPCAFQIRFGGCKGVVAVSKNIDEKHQGKRLFYRDSMIKYWSTHKTIEVLSSCARPQELYLNQQLIMLLSYLGVSDHVFMRLLNESLTTLSKMFVEEKVARRKLRSISCEIDWEALERTNFLVTTDPFMRSMLMALYRLQMKGLREKSRIQVDPSKARVLIGTVDETRTLHYGQVFIQISKHLQNPGAEKIILKRKVVIGKSPCLHPGDVRTFDAVDCAALHHMCDCVVFPCQGKRPHPHELSGSDLDGDLYHVIWDDDLMPTVANKAPMDYSTSKVATVNKNITSDDMLHFLRQNIEHDCLGQIDNTHKAIADQKGLDCEACLELARLHSQAVDAPKTGDWTSVPRTIRRMLDKYPDFMMKQDKPSYPSEKVLGVMYRECTKFLNTCSIHKTTFDFSAVTATQSIAEIKGKTPFLEEARKIRERYNGQLQELMSMYGVVTEAEFISGFVEKLHDKIGKEVADVGILLSDLRRRLVHKFRDLFFKDSQITPGGVVDEEKARCKAAAWYHVCYSPSEACEFYTIGTTKIRFLSFAWIASDYLMACLAASETTQPTDNAFERIGRSIYDQLQNSSSRLIKRFDEQLEIREEMKAVLARREPKMLPFLYGMSYCLLFDDQKPETELLMWTEHMERHLFNSWTMESHVLRELGYAIKCSLQDSGIECKNVQSGKRTLLHFNRFNSYALGRTVPGHVAIDPLCCFQSALLLEYIYHNPWLLPLLRVVVKWTRATEFVGGGRSSLVDSLTVCFMVVDYCLCQMKDAIHVVDPSTVMDALRDGHFESWSSVEFWKEVLEVLFDEEHKKPPGAPLGKLLLGFFADDRQGSISAIHPSLQWAMGCEYYWQTCSVGSMQLLQEEMQRAFHKLSFHSSIEPLFQSVDTEKVLHLPAGAAHRMAGSEEFFARLYSKQTKTHVEVHQKGDKSGGLLIKIAGSNTGIHAVEKHLELFKERSVAMDHSLNKYPGVMELFIKDSCKCIVEGIVDWEEKITLDDYWGARHPEDDNKGLYVIRVIAPSEKVPDALYDLNSAKFLGFREMMMESMQFINSNESYSSFIHGPMRLQISFGKYYLITPPGELLERPEGISMTQLRTALSATPQHYVENVHSWKHEISTPPKSSAPALHQQPRTAFFSKLHPAISRADLENLLIAEYGLKEVSNEESFTLALRGQCHGIWADYNSDLELVSILYPPVRWMMTTIKGFYRERNEVDVRFDLSSRSPCELPHVRSKVERGLRSKFHGIKDASVEDHLIPLVDTLKHIRQRSFVFPESDPKAFWGHVTVVVNDVTVISRPKRSIRPDFATKERFFELRLFLNPGKIGPLLCHKNFIGEMWYQTLWLSDRLEQLAADSKRKGNNNTAGPTEAFH